MLQTSKIIYVLLSITVVSLFTFSGCASRYDRLRSAIDNNDDKRAERILKSGIDPNEYLERAVRKGSHETARLFLNQGANPNRSESAFVIDNLYLVYHKTGEKFVINTRLSEDGQNWLFEADKEVLLDLMKIKKNEKVTYEYTVNWAVDGRTPIFYAIENDDFEMTSLLLENGAIINKPYAVYNAIFLQGSILSQSLLLSMGNEARVNNHYVRKMGDLYISDSLPLKGEIHTALEYAKIKKRNRIIELLENYNKK